MNTQGILNPVFFPPPPTEEVTIMNVWVDGDIVTVLYADDGDLVFSKTMLSSLGFDGKIRLTINEE